MGEFTLPLVIDLRTHKLADFDGVGLTELPPLVLGDQVVCSLRTLDRDGTRQFERNLNVRSIRASLGKTMEAPTEGHFILSGSEDSAQITANATAAEFATAVGNTLGTLENCTSTTAGCWVFQSTSEPHLVTNRLRPVSFVRIREWQENGETWREVRTIQAPLAFNNGHERVLPDAPSIEEIRRGGSGSSNDDIAINEIQALKVPSDFRGTYTLVFDFRETRLLGTDDGVEEIEAALNALWSDGQKRFSVTNPEADKAYIEFVGPLGDEDQNNITATVKTWEPGVLTFTMNLATSEMADALRAVAEVTVLFEIELEVVSDDEDASDPEVPGRLLTIFQQSVKVVREQIWEELSTVQAINWMSPPQPRDYRPFTLNQIITGVQHYTAAFGNGVSRSFAFDHNLNTAAMHVTVRENATNGRLLAPTEFDVHFPSANQTAIDFPVDEPPPASNALAVTLSSAGPISAFQAHTHSIAQVIGLQDALNALGARISAIELLLPSGVTPASSSSAVRLEIALTDKAEVLPGRFAANFNADTAIKSGAGLPARGAGLLPAIHDATVANVTLPLGDSAAFTGQVVLNNTAGTIMLPGGLGRRSQPVRPGGFLGSDGRAWYRLTHDGTTKSYFPTDFERELFMVFVNENQLRAGSTLTLEFDLTVAMLKAETRAQYLLSIEVGAAPSQLTPATTGTNLEDVTWIAAAVLNQRLIVSGTAIKHRFGCAVTRNELGELSSSRLLYGAWEGGAQAPASPNFALRARLLQFDTENSVAGARGFVAYQFTNGRLKIS